MVDISSRDIKGMRTFLQNSVQKGYNVTFGVVPDMGPALETSSGSGSLVYRGSSRPAKITGVPLLVNRGVILAIGEMRIQDEMTRYPGVYAVLDDAGIIRPFYVDDFMGANDFSRDKMKFDPWVANPHTRALVELRDMYETSFQSHDFLPGILSSMMSRQLPLLVLPYRYRIERNITEPTAMECILEDVVVLHKAVRKKGFNPLAKEFVPIGTRAKIKKLGFNTGGEFKWSGRLERDFLQEGYSEEDVYEPRRTADVNLI
ncbi:MAG: hypothetical protein HY362_03120 [Candidatus Aenigmarchaeota archaeon]|nr:hypothetical protein [Candidatus Aenigmarchaeota archaeon]